jgi:hypothetical protein
MKRREEMNWMFVEENPLDYKQMMKRSLKVARLQERKTMEQSRMGVCFTSHWKLEKENISSNNTMVVEQTLLNKETTNTTNNKSTTVVYKQMFEELVGTQELKRIEKRYTRASGTKQERKRISIEELLN